MTSRLVKFSPSLEVFTIPDEVLKQLIPSNIEVVTAYEAIGHIAHMNLRDDCLPYRKIIGQVILDVRFSSFFLHLLIPFRRTKQSQPL